MATQTEPVKASESRKRSPFRAIKRLLVPMLLDCPRQFYRITLFRFTVAAIRYVWLVLILKRLRTVQGTGVAASTLHHNLRGMFDLAVERSLRLIYPIVSIEGIRNDIANRKILTIGPRTEGEIYNLYAYGFRRKNVTCLDLISYSGRVDLGDMHAMPYADSSFDCVMLGWVINYSDDKQRAADEIVRVAKPGGIVAIGVEWNRISAEELDPQKFGYVVGSAQRLSSAEAILALFGDSVDRVYFEQDDQDQGAREGDILVVFKLRQRFDQVNQVLNLSA